MNTTPDAPITAEGAILANLEILDQLLAHARYLAGDAAEAMHAGKRNLAIGTITGLEQLLPEIEAFALELFMKEMAASGIRVRLKGDS